ncbi:RNA-binding domain superfamily [Sesbania bispinosa]|nr:RNA-binding domain superfamily [Sesbania bispinosa]
MASADELPLEETQVAMEEVKEETHGDEGKEQSQIRVIKNPNDINKRKIFVGGLSSGTSEEEFKKYFEKFGTIIDAVVMQDTVTHRPRGFGFITFDSEKSVEDILVNNFHDFNGKQVEVKRVVPKEDQNRECVVCLEKSRSNKNYNILPSRAPLPYYNNNEPYAHGSTNTYGGWYLMNGFRGNGYAVPYNPYNYGSIMYVPMVTMGQANQAYFLPSLAYAASNVGQ